MPLSNTFTNYKLKGFQLQLQKRGSSVDGIHVQGSMTHARKRPWLIYFDHLHNSFLCLGI